MCRNMEFSKMSYGFSMPMSFGNEMQQNQQPMYDTYGTPYPDVAVNQNQATVPIDNNYMYSNNYGYRKPSSLPAALGGFAVGGATAGILKARKNYQQLYKIYAKDTQMKLKHLLLMQENLDLKTSQIILTSKN